MKEFYSGGERPPAREAVREALGRVTPLTSSPEIDRDLEVYAMNLAFSEKKADETRERYDENERDNTRNALAYLVAKHPTNGKIAGLIESAKRIVQHFDGFTELYKRLSDFAAGGHAPVTSDDVKYLNEPYVPQLLQWLPEYLPAQSAETATETPPTDEETGIPREHTGEPTGIPADTSNGDFLGAYDSASTHLHNASTAYDAPAAEDASYNPSPYESAADVADDIALSDAIYDAFAAADDTDPLET